MSKNYSRKYFLSKLKKLRLQVCRKEDYKTIDELLFARAGKNINQNQGREK